MKGKKRKKKATPKCIPCSFTCQFFSSDVFLSWSKSPDFTITTNTQDKSWNDVILTLTSTMVLMSFRLGVCRAQRNLTSRVLPQPVSPITITGMLHLNTQWDSHQDAAPEHTVRQSPGCCTWTHSGTITGMLHLNTQWDNHQDVAPEHTVGQSLGQKEANIPESHVDGQNLLDIVGGEFICVIRVNDLVVVKDFLVIQTQHAVQAQQTVSSAAKSSGLLPLVKSSGLLPLVKSSGLLPLVKSSDLLPLVKSSIRAQQEHS